ncbi:MAG: cupin domain-containing protein [Halanaerobiales bacterium]|nr:cupin domain-containing protein [Halanaerobiales bacterium]
MSIIRLENIETEKNKRGIKIKNIIKNDNVAVKNLILEQSDVIVAHQVSVDVLFHVIEGQGSIMIGEEVYGLKAKDFISCPPNTPMKVMADKGVKFSVLNIKTPSL